LLILRPTSRNNGLGPQVYQQTALWIQKNGGTSVRLITQEQNPKALKFWTGLGFEQISTSNLTHGDKDSKIIKLSKSLT
jgi:ribosomal protein S18 acetylase RimI-like enzyme